jgi:hypothetical protein
MNADKTLLLVFHRRLSAFIGGWNCFSEACAISSALCFGPPALP